MTIDSRQEDDIAELKRMKKALRESEANLRALSAQRLVSEERERRLIATELHDNLGQKLALIKMRLEEMQQAGGTHQGCCDLTPACDMLEEAIQYTRSLTFQLSPPILQDLGLVPALEWLAEDFRRKHELNITFSRKRPSITLSHEARVVLFRACRELLMNIVKHAQAKNVELALDERDGRITIAVEDDGVGFQFQPTSTDAKTWSFGLFSISESMKYLDGDMAVESAQGRKTRIILAAPLNALQGGESQWGT